MLPNSPNSLCSLTHTTHTTPLVSHTAPTSTHVDNPDGINEEDEAEQHGGDSEFLEGESPGNLSGDFDFDEFYDFATRVLNGDSDSLASLNSLKVRWQQKFKTRRNPTLKSVIGRPSTPFRPRISLLPRRFVRTGMDTLPAPSVEHSNILVGGSRSSELDTHGCSSSPKSGPVSQEQVPQEGAIIQDCDAPTQFGDLVDSAVQDGRDTGLRRRLFIQFSIDFAADCPRRTARTSGHLCWIAMEEVIEGGPWLFQGQPIVLQFWEQGMSLRRQKHTQIPVWIRLRHLPMEYWTDEGFSTVASGIGTSLYTDGITKDCSRLDYAWVCVMLDFNSELPKHLVVISGMSAKLDPVQPAQDTALAGPAATLVCKNSAPVLSKGKEIILYNSYGALDIEGNDSQLAGPNNRSPTVEGS
ncbi:hypothetical protein Sango_2990800 [Sesamum angolense]|uniref:DUF4283 domain-containing protein n=1 Tax=Sesamum angolense TaxID=2727404 RepID=A0AAE1T439_9LAMI|nr:hypothetical protein Sango_2990800 [Sesamum angolense]